ncbi:MAG TPA: hypothetical protein VFX78_11380 [Candidatus Eisenbacteria bacterium]|nr:hypothetical protein [Candidatus Eisenbacteria bacterium]
MTKPKVARSTIDRVFRTWLWWCDECIKDEPTFRAEYKRARDILFLAYSEIVDRIDRGYDIPKKGARPK